MSKKPGKAVAAPKSAVPAAWRDKLKALAVQESERVAVGSGNNIALKKDGSFVYQGATIAGEMDVIILDHVIARKYYTKVFDEDNPSPPACFALKADAKNMAPHADSPDVQAQICSECPWNEWKSDQREKGKACREKERLAVIHVDSIKKGDDLANAEVALLEVPPTSLGTFRKYVKKITGGLEVPLWAVVTRLSLRDDKDYQVLNAPEMVDSVPESMYEQLMKMAEAARATVLEPYKAEGYVPPKNARKPKALSKLGGDGKKRSRLS